ncbi:hypothetical protein AGMMS50249_3600 [candidate division SR1 bacterium]|nr:hypothetical protein AGMMS50249_3600 [candidate division SR1 bacterium]
MFYLWQEQYDAKYSKFRGIKEQKDFGLQSYFLYESLESIIQQTLQYPKYQHVFLLDDQRFHFFHFEIKKQVDIPITLKDIQTLILQKTFEANQQTKEVFLFSVFDDIFIDGNPQKFLIGKKGEIHCTLTLIYANRATILAFNDVYGDIRNQKKIKLIPKHFYTVEYLKKHINLRDFLILDIEDSMAQVLQINDGQYQIIESINFGINALMQMYKDAGISKYRYKNMEEIEKNVLAKNLVIQTLEFYVNMLCKWLSDLKILGTTVFLISPIMKNVHFIDIFNQTYRKNFISYIVPLHISPDLDTFSKQREIEDIDAIIYLNSFPPEKRGLE